MSVVADVRISSVDGLAAFGLAILNESAFFAGMFATGAGLLLRDGGLSDPPAVAFSMFLSRLGAVSLSVLGCWVPFSVPLEIYFSPEGLMSGASSMSFSRRDLLKYRGIRAGARDTCDNTPSFISQSALVLLLSIT